LTQYTDGYSVRTARYRYTRWGIDGAELYLRRPAFASGSLEGGMRIIHRGVSNLQFGCFDAAAALDA